MKDFFKHSVVRVIGIILLLILISGILSGGSSSNYEGECGDGGYYDADC